MRAHLRDLHVRRCGAPARVELFNTFNAPLGCWCRRTEKTTGGSKAGPEIPGTVQVEPGLYRITSATTIFVNVKK